MSPSSANCGPFFSSKDFPQLLDLASSAHSPGPPGLRAIAFLFITAFYARADFFLVYSRPLFFLSFSFVTRVLLI